jgi:hypothetical protein
VVLENVKFLKESELSCKPSTKSLLLKKRRESTKMLEILEFNLVRSLNFYAADDILHPIVLLSKKDENY